MKDQSFEIKVSDLLNQVAVDEISFENKRTNLIPNLTKDWISGKVRLSWIDDENVFVEIEELHCSLDEVCDYCTENFVRNIDVKWYSARFTLNKKEKDYANDEVLFFIDEKNVTINIEEMVYQAISLETPFVIYCQKCNDNHNLENADDDEIYWEVNWWNITFH